MTRRRGEQCLSDLVIDRWLAGELTLAERRLAEGHVSSCDPCRSRRAELIASRQGFAHDAPPFEALQRRPSHAASAKQSSDAPASRRSPLGGRWVAGAAALAAAAVVAVAIGQPWRVVDPLSTRTKGPIASLSWVVRRGERVFAGDPHEPLRDGDAVRFTVSAREGVCVAIFGLDDATEPRAYFPEGELLAKVEAGRDRVLSMAIELDASPQDEHGYAVYCRSPEPVARVRDAIALSVDEPRLPAGCSAERWSLPKERP